MLPELETVKEIFHDALDCAPDKVSAFLDERCAGDETLRGTVEELLAAHRQAGDFIETPIATFVSSIRADNGETDLLIGQRVGHYKILKRISSGGMGAVYLAERADQQYEKQVAIKLIKRGMDTDSVLRHFRNERQILASFDHPNIARLLDGGATDAGLPYFVMEYVEGLPIDQYCEKHALSIAERLKLFRQVCAAVMYAHRHTVIHRDIKPSNIVVTSDGVPKLLDFGIAKILQPGDRAEALATITGLRLMTPEYASPEQVRGEPISAATDVYSLGVVLYQLLTGEKPYRLKTRTPEEISRAILEQEPPRPSTAIATAENPKLLKGDLDNIVLMALRKEPERRYQSAEQFSEDIRRHLEGLPVLARKDTLAYRSAKFVQRNPTLAAVATACLLLALAVAWLLRWQFAVPPKIPASDKSIAVLPFQNLSKEPDDAFFADGVQDEILSSLAKVAELKVISRTSVSQYKDATKRNLREIGQQLGVAHVLEGSVQRVANRLRIHAQLIDARSDAHLWAQTYDREVADIFDVQSEIAKAIADQLQAEISQAEQAAIIQPPTKDIVANSLYAQARVLELTPPPDKNLPAAAELLNEAVSRDPQFLLAYCLLSQVHLGLFATGYDQTPARRELAHAALQKAVQLQPDAGEVHLALARYSYYGFRDYDRARSELELARRTLPNAAELFFITGQIARRQGRWAEAIRNFEHAVELDPRYPGFLGHTGGTYELLRRYADATRYYRQAAAITFVPGSRFFPLLESYQPFQERADVGPLRRELSRTAADEAVVSELFVDLSFRCAMAERDSAALDRALALIPAEGIGPYAENAVYPRAWYVGLAARAVNNMAAADESFTAARVVAEKLVRDQPDHAAAWSLLGKIDAALGRKEEAVSEGRRSCELLPISKDAVVGAGLVTNLAMIYAWVGEKDLALEQLAISAQIPAGVTYGALKLDPAWDPLRDDPRFEKIAASLAPNQITLE